MTTATDNIPHQLNSDEHSNTTPATDHKSGQGNTDDIDKHSSVDEAAESTVVQEPQPDSIPDETSSPQPRSRPLSASQSGPAQEYLVKNIEWFDVERREKRPVKIITQNENGPCPLVAICNVLFLRDDLAIQPPDREMVTFEYLVDRLGDYLLNNSPPEKPTTEQPLASSPSTISPVHEEPGLGSEQSLQKEKQTTSEYTLNYRYNLDAALSILPNLQTGLDVNVRFSSIRDFEPTAELAMFDLFHVDLVHGWIADPQDEETYKTIVEKCGSYNSVVECVVKGDTLSSGVVVDCQDGQTEANPAEPKKWTAEEERQIQEGLVAAAFLQDTATQLTYYGLELLSEMIPDNKLCVIFRNNHFSTIYKHPETHTLYTLVTDSGFIGQNSYVWESLNDVDQGMSEFFDSGFQPSRVLGDPAPPRSAPTTAAEANADLDDHTANTEAESG
ncbi:hypothetical protein BCR43DRAFT_518075 [Syncephalastrum racemosum]|uniref:MINDY deubiquitinase domain-containing protein n=1 Tax=Syncephalastrum racemosum TaxID=13706 RepID=A0A1X2H2N5_SYNRA|nr:hypothetical protein BCR43DRAFT_518075 [Syncephalastrum racemosum]